MATASQVSRLLGTKFGRSIETKSSMVRGWSNFTKGFSVRQGFYSTDPVLVDYIQGDAGVHMPKEERERRQEQAFAEYTDLLKSKGYTVVEAAHGTSRRVLEVTK